MSDELIMKAAALMRDQAEAYVRLDAACARLSDYLAGGQPSVIVAQVRAVEGETLRMRSRLVQLMGALTSFSEGRAQAPERYTLSPQTRADFEAASAELLRAARAFKQTQERAAALANGGSTFAAACIQQCGVKPTTYRAPYARLGEGRPWA